jgi:hypothetical protein
LWKLSSLVLSVSEISFLVFKLAGFDDIGVRRGFFLQMDGNLHPDQLREGCVEQVFLSSRFDPSVATKKNQHNPKYFFLLP